MIKRMGGVFLLAATLFFNSCETKQVRDQADQATKVVGENTDNGSQKSFSHQLIYTKHARCRMDCRHINEQEIQEIISADHINARKSNPNDSRCPTYAYEGYSHDHQHLRIVIAKCDEVWKVVTCIDLENEFACECH